MTVWAHRFLVIPDAQKATARELAIKIANTAGPGSADGMWLTGLNATGTGIPTHWVACGLIDANFAAILGNASATFTAYQQAGGTLVTLAQVQALYTAATIRSDLNFPGGPQQGIAALGLQLISGVL